MNNPLFDVAQIGLFWGLGKGVWRQNAFDIMAKYATLIHNNKSIQRLLSELGREGLREGEELINARKSIGEVRFSRSQKSDIAGIMESDDLSSLLPMEVAMLSEPRLEADFYKRFTEKKLRTFSYQSKISKYVDAIENKIRLQEEKCGPFIVCIDTSGSMSGTPEELAKTICYGLIVKSQEQKRNCFVITFSTHVEVLDISDLKNNSKAILDFLMHSFNGGTDLSPALRKAALMLEDERYRKADVLFISDFIAEDFERRVIDAIRTAKNRKTRFHALRIGQFSNEDLLSHFNVEWTYKRGQIFLERDSTCA